MAQILIVVQNQSAPTDRRVWQEASALTRAGHEIVVLSPCGPDRDRERHVVLEGISVFRYPPALEVTGAFKYFLEYGWAIVRSLLLAMKLDRSHRFDIVHICNPPDLLFLVALPLKLRGALVVFDHHDPAPEVFAARFGDSRTTRVMVHLLRLLERATFGIADYVLSTNERMGELARGRGNVKPHAHSIVPNGPDLARLTPTPLVPALRHGRAKLVCYLGIMGPQDGVDLALHTVAHLRHRLGRTDVMTAFIGDGDVRPAMERLAADLGIADSVVFTGFLSWDRLAPYLSTADVCISPDASSALNQIVTQNKIVEYMAMARPVVTFDLTAARAVAGDAALYAPPGDTAALAGLVAQLLDDPKEAQRRGQIGRLRVERELAWEHVEPRLLAAYATVVDRIRRRP